jgi:phage gp36-like protein
MGIFLLVFRFFLPLPDMAAVLLSVASGAAIYVMVLLRLDREIHNEIRDVCTSFGMPWPRWL